MVDKGDSKSSIEEHEGSSPRPTKPTAGSKLRSMYVRVMETWWSILNEVSTGIS